jgi:hypothetical protein
VLRTPSVNSAPGLPYPVVAITLSSRATASDFDAMARIDSHHLSPISAHDSIFNNIATPAAGLRATYDAYHSQMCFAFRLDAPSGDSTGLDGDDADVALALRVESKEAVAPTKMVALQPKYPGILRARLHRHMSRDDTVVIQDWLSQIDNELQHTSSEQFSDNIDAAKGPATPIRKVSVAESQSSPAKTEFSDIFDRFNSWEGDSGDVDYDSQSSLTSVEPPSEADDKDPCTCDEDGVDLSEVTAVAPDNLKEHDRYLHLTGCLQCVLKGMHCDKILPSCSRCVRASGGQVCLHQCRKFYAPKEQEPVLLRLPGEADDVHQEKVTLQGRVSAPFITKDEVAHFAPSS